MATQKEAALSEVEVQYRELVKAQQTLDNERADFAAACKEAHEHGISDQEIADLTKETGDGYSRARIQQFRCGDPRRAKVAA